MEDITLGKVTIHADENGLTGFKVAGKEINRSEEGRIGHRKAYLVEDKKAEGGVAVKQLGAIERFFYRLFHPGALSSKALWSLLKEKKVILDDPAVPQRKDFMKEVAHRIKLFSEGVTGKKEVKSEPVKPTEEGKPPVDVEKFFAWIGEKVRRPSDVQEGLKKVLEEKTTDREQVKAKLDALKSNTKTLGIYIKLYQALGKNDKYKDVFPVAKPTE